MWWIITSFILSNLVLHCIDEIFTRVVLQSHLKALTAGGEAYWDSTQIATHWLHLHSLVPCLLLLCCSRRYHRRWWHWHTPTTAWAHTAWLSFGRPTRISAWRSLEYWITGITATATSRQYWGMKSQNIWISPHTKFNDYLQKVDLCVVHNLQKNLTFIKLMFLAPLLSNSV